MTQESHPAARSKPRISLTAVGFALALLVLILGLGRPTLAVASASMAVLAAMAVLSVMWFCVAVAASRFVKPSPWWVRGNSHVTSLLIQFAVVAVAWAAQASIPES